MVCRCSRPIRKGGAVVALVAVLLVVILGVTAFALEGGLLLETRRKAQTVADASAMAAAADMYEYYQSDAGTPRASATTAATAAAAANDFANDADPASPTPGSTWVSVLLFPSNYAGGPHAGTQIPKGYAEVIVTKWLPRYFSQVWGTGLTPVSARAVARGQWLPSADGVIALNTTASPDITTMGNPATIVVTSSPTAGQASVVANSNAATAISGNITADRIFSPGGSSVVGVPYTRLPGPIQDPLAYLPAPSASAATAALGQGLPTDPPSLGTTTVNGTSYTIYGPGIYNSAPSPGNKTGVLFQPDPNHPNYAPVIMLLGGGWGTVSQGTVTSNGIMIYSAGDGSHFSGKSVVNLSPPTTGPYAGISYFQARGDTSSILVTGQASINITGAYYAPNGVLSARGNGDVNIGSQLIFDSGDTRGNGALNVNYNPNNVPKIRQIQLVE